MSTETCCASAEPNTLPNRARRWWRRNRPRLYMVPGYGIAYRAVMRVAHRFGWHYAPPTYGPDIDRVYHWCKWCGLRWNQPASLNRYKIRIP
jgi:hypothetical protein